MINEVSVLNRANDVIHYNMGQCFKVSRIGYDKVNNMWYAFVNYSYPTVIDDPANNERFIKSIIFKQIFKISFDSKGNIVYIPSLEDLKSRIISNIKRDIRKLSDVLIDITSEKLVKIPTIRNAMIPFERIFQEIEEEEKLSVERINRLKRVNKKINMYLEILEALGLIRKYYNGKEKVGYVKDNKYIEIEHMRMNIKRKLDFLLAYVLKHGYSLILEKVRLYAIVPFIRYQDIYYYSTYHVGEIVHFNEKEFIRKSIEFYGRRPNKIKMRGQLEWLIKTDILEKENHYYVGNEKIYEELIKNLA